MNLTLRYWITTVGISLALMCMVTSCVQYPSGANDYRTVPTTNNPQYTGDTGADMLPGGCY